MFTRELNKREYLGKKRATHGGIIVEQRIAVS